MTPETEPTRPGAIDAELVSRYVAGECGAAEQAAVERWLCEDPARNGIVRAFRGRPGSPAADALADDGDSAAAWTRFRATRLERAEQGARAAGGVAPAPFAARSVGRQGGVPFSGASRAPWRAYASAALCVVAAAGVAWLGREARRTEGGGDRAVPMRRVASGTGQIVTLTLADGTRVTLNAGSTLDVPRDLGRSRTVVLDGEALFEVTHRGAEPFVVRNGPARVTVLGTTFAVRRYHGERRLRVAVAEGRVSVRPGGARPLGEAIINARTVAEVSDSGPTVLTPTPDVSQYTDWTRGRLVFRDTPLREAIPELERRYGLTIRLADPAFGDQQLTATIAGDPARAVLDGISVILGAKYVRDGNTVTFLARRTAPPRSRAQQPFSPRIEVSHGK